MRLWRISIWPGLTGEGGLHTASRWHTLGQRIVYAAEHPALAMVETMAHMRLGLATIPLNLKLIPIDVAAGATMSPTPPLPTGWQANELMSQAIGDAWLREGNGLLLPIPSAILAHAMNYLLNPGHAQALTHLIEGTPEPFWFDKRFLR